MLQFISITYTVLFFYNVTCYLVNLWQCFKRYWSYSIGGDFLHLSKQWV